MVIFNPIKIVDLLPQIVPFLPITLGVIFLSALIGTLLGAILAKWRLSKNVVLNRLAEGFVFIMRCTPPIVLLFIVYYGLPKLLIELFGYDINSYNKALFVIISFVFLFAAAVSEIFRSAYLAVDAGQKEAALATGLSEWQTFYRILLPQTTVVALPNYCNSFVSLMKDGTLAYTIGLIDIMGEANLIIGRNYGNFTLETYFSIAIIYWGLILLLEGAFNFFEKKLTVATLPIERQVLTK